MKNIYEVGRIYVWRNQRAPYEWLNGEETIVTSDVIVEMLHGKQHYGQKTDTVGRLTGKFILAESGDLCAKDRPSGEQSVLDQFKLLEPDTV